MDLTNKEKARLLRSAASALEHGRHATARKKIREALTDLYSAAEEALGMLQRVQEKEGEGPDAMPWPEIDRLDLALKGMGI